MLWPLSIIQWFFRMSYTVKTPVFRRAQSFWGMGSKPACCGNLGLARRNLGTSPEGAVSYIRHGHFRAPEPDGTFRSASGKQAPRGHFRTAHTSLRVPFARSSRAGCGRSVDFFLHRERNGRAGGGVREPDPGAAGGADPDG